jgi:hypothetical protein
MYLGSLQRIQLQIVASPDSHPVQEATFNIGQEHICSYCCYSWHRLCLMLITVFAAPEAAVGHNAAPTCPCGRTASGNLQSRHAPNPAATPTLIYRSCTAAGPTWGPARISQCTTSSLRIPPAGSPLHSRGRSKQPLLLLCNTSARAAPACFWGSGSAAGATALPRRCRCISSSFPLHPGGWGRCTLSSQRQMQPNNSRSSSNS